MNRAATLRRYRQFRHALATLGLAAGLWANARWAFAQGEAAAARATAVPLPPPLVGPPASAKPASDGAATPEPEPVESPAAKIKRDLGQQIFFNGDRTSVNRDLHRQIVEGEVVVIGAGTLIGADKITFDQASNVVEAQGSVVVLNRNQLFLGTDVTYHMDTQDFLITNASMQTNDPKSIEAVTERIFGFGPKEVAFEQARQQQLVEISQRLTAIQREVARLGAPDDDLIDHYVLLLQRRELIQKQENPGLAALPPDRREMFKRRREFWESGRGAGAANQGVTFTAYLHLDGETLKRLDGNDFSAHNALFTPCRCDKDEAPAWAFRADAIDAQIGGYADLRNAVLEIKGVPVLYLPYLKLPIKDKRQSGFLEPVTN